MALFTLDGVLDVARGPNSLIPDFTKEVQTLPRKYKLYRAPSPLKSEQDS